VSLLYDPIPLLRVPVVAFVVITINFAVVLVFFLVWLLVWLFSKAVIGGVRVVRSEGFWIHSVHAQWYAPPLLTAWTAIMTIGAVTLFSSFRSSDLSQSI
jgi:hypothetical protein